jgi:hypothetical protein
VDVEKEIALVAQRLSAREAQARQDFILNISNKTFAVAWRSRERRAALFIPWKPNSSSRQNRPKVNLQRRKLCD